MDCPQAVPNDEDAAKHLKQEIDFSAQTELTTEMEVLNNLRLPPDVEKSWHDTFIATKQVRPACLA